jgi:hypothetical protein
MCEVIVLVHDRWRVLLSAGMFATKKLWGGKKKESALLHLFLSPLLFVWCRVGHLVNYFIQIFIHVFYTF